MWEGVLRLVILGGCITPCNIFSFFKIRGGGYTFTFFLKTDKPDKNGHF